MIVENYIIFGDKNLRDYGLWISGGGTFDGPVRTVERISVPGRSGDLTLDKGRYPNVTLTYDAFISRDFSRNIAALRAYLGSCVGYKRLEDTYHPDEFRLAMFSEAIKPSTTPRNLAGTMKLTFNCKPQRWLKSGEVSVSVNGAGVLNNPTLFAAKPMLRAYGTGTLTINGVTVRITSANQYTDIDCELMDAYKGTTNCNGNIVLTNGIFPELPPGRVTISTTGLTNLVITPRWWTL